MRAMCLLFEYLNAGRWRDGSTPGQLLLHFLADIKNVRPSQSSPFHPPCPSRDRFKKALRLSCDLLSERQSSPLVLRTVFNRYRHSTGKENQLQRQLTLWSWRGSEMQQRMSVISCKSREIAAIEDVFQYR